MSGHRPEVADVIRTYAGDYLGAYGASAEQRQVLQDLAQCRTQALGGHKYRCELCGHEKIVYNSCGNRHCPKCQAAARAEWLKQRQKDLLEVPYFHLVFTVPDELGPLALQNKKLVYGILFRAASETLLAIAKGPKHLGAEIGFLAVLHTWGQNLHLHPHLHCVVPGGGLSPDGRSWVSCKDNFFLPVRVLSRLFRGKFLSYLHKAFDDGDLQFFGKLEQLARATSWKRFFRQLRSREWVVYSKPPFGGPQQVLKYLARYTHRVAISNQRLASLEGGKLSFRYKDYAQGNRQRTMTLKATEFIRRFLLHVLPSGFMRIRYYGFLANCHRDKKLAQARSVLGEQPDNTMPCEDEPRQQLSSDNDHDTELCPKCKTGRLRFLERLEPQPCANYQLATPDTS
ncbi:MAG: IS91 family transposase [Acidobacteriota bacterium]